MPQASTNSTPPLALPGISSADGRQLPGATDGFRSSRQRPPFQRWLGATTAGGCGCFPPFPPSSPLLLTPPGGLPRGLEELLTFVFFGEGPPPPLGLLLILLLILPLLAGLLLKLLKLWKLRKRRGPKPTTTTPFGGGPPPGVQLQTPRRRSYPRFRGPFAFGGGKTKKLPKAMKNWIKPIAAAVALLATLTAALRHFVAISEGRALPAPFLPRTCPLGGATPQSLRWPPTAGPLQPRWVSGLSQLPQPLPPTPYGGLQQWLWDLLESWGLLAPGDCGCWLPALALPLLVVLPPLLRWWQQQASPPKPPFGGGSAGGSGSTEAKPSPSSFSGRNLSAAPPGTVKKEGNYAIPTPTTCQGAGLLGGCGNLPTPPPWGWLNPKTTPIRLEGDAPFRAWRYEPTLEWRPSRSLYQQFSENLAHYYRDQLRPFAPAPTPPQPRVAEGFANPTPTPNPPFGSGGTSEAFPPPTPTGGAIGDGPRMVPENLPDPAAVSG